MKDGRSFDRELRSEFALLHRNLALWSLALLAVLTLGSTLLVRARLEPVADALSLSLRSSILVRDLRGAMATLENSLVEDFEAVRYAQDGEEVFSLPALGSFWSQPWRSLDLGELRRELPLDAAGGKSFGTVEFRYARFALFPWIFALWTLLVAASLPILAGFRRRLVLRHEERLTAREEAAFGRLAQQVAHDLRAPLVALRSVEDVLPLPAAESRLFNAAVIRLTDIADDLLQPATKRPLQIVSLAATLEQCLMEAKARFRAREEISWDLVVPPQAFDAASQLVPSELKRVIANLLNNAAEALREEGRIVLSLSAEGAGSWAICVEDTGSGIPDHLMNKVLERGFSFGKSEGSGLGLWDAQDKVRAWGGRLDLRSREGEGTCVSLVLPAVESVFAASLALDAQSRVAVLEDDLSVQGAWRRRLSQSCAEVACWDEPPAQAPKAHLFLVDEDYVGLGSKGLDWIVEEGLEKQAFLVTNRFEDSELIDRCRNAGVSLLPKNLLSRVPLSLRD
jgi:signal transduction histidine kinase